MSIEVETFEYRGHEIVILVEEYPQNPRTEWDNLGTMICFHKRYNLGDEHDFNPSYYHGWSDLAGAIIEEYDPCVMLPLYLYDHSGLRIKVGSFQGLLPQGHAEFDSGPIGWILAEKDKVRKEWGKKRISKQLQEKVRGILVSEVETYDQYVSGQVYGFQIRTKDGDLDGGCWGYYGSDWETNGLLDSAIPEIDYLVNENVRKGVQECIDNRQRAFQHYLEEIEVT